ncbi:MAG: hypothetical protein ACM3TT_06685 [Syntrophothermus sp.]
MPKALQDYRWLNLKTAFDAGSGSTFLVLQQNKFSETYYRVLLFENEKRFELFRGGSLAGANNVFQSIAKSHSLVKKAVRNGIPA